eukprot:scaffold28753_cov67-Phaeocystis_antarctica.AAC.1
MDTVIQRADLGRTLVAVTEVGLRAAEGLTGGIEASIIYNSKLFERKVAEQLVARLQTAVMHLNEWDHKLDIADARAVPLFEQEDMRAPTAMMVAGTGASVTKLTNGGFSAAMPFGRVTALAGAAAALPAYMMPSVVVGVREWPRTSSAKIDRNRLPAPEGGSGAAAAE